ncbi:protein-methionine sulfoxide oxidase mical2b isoform X2 [Electrophorus electricus]|uniref:protein-methionine sulfoxide oxidase mical2b isoform X2 n=1 Tax=Electrophorus electricus TaxID=8005 RepID=UPI0015D0B3B4|nr:protein-methionine sulfoxide oxidase mical2b isoform X2 [Electrophorus electricus]
MGETEDERGSQANQLFEIFVQASTCKGTLQAFSVLCRQLDLLPAHHPGFYSSLKAAITSWKAKALWTKLDKRANHKEYKKGKACADIRCLVIGAGPCGLRTAIELALLGAKVVVIEKRDTFSRNNVLHLWPYTIHDLRNLGAKKFYGKFCAGAIDHISIRQLQLILLKVCLILGVEVHVNVEFLKLQEPTEEQDNHGHGWRAEISPPGQPIANYEFDVLIGSDGRRSTLDGFRRKEFRGKLAIAITANFVNRNTTAEAKVEEISGVAFIFNQKFFLELKEETGIDLENIVYYKDNTHYFVMTAKKQSLLDKGVIIHDYIETERLLHTDNVNQEALLSYAREAADFGTNYQLPSLDYAINHYSQPDVAMFDFTCMYASENAALIRQKSGRQLLVALVGDSLLEPFWPMGTGCARGFLAAFDTAWMVKGWAQGKAPLELLSERESIYRLLPQTTAENITKNFDQYTIDPATRYPNLNSSCVRPQQVRHLYINGEQTSVSLEHGGPSHRSVSTSRKGSEVRSSRLLLWCQKQTQGYRSVDVTDLTTSWRSGLALCALIHRQRPDLIDFDSLNEADSAKNNQLAFEVAEQAFGIQPLITGKEMAAEQEPDKLVMVLYLSKFYELLCHSALPVSVATQGTDENNEDYSSKSTASVYNLMNLALPRKRIPKDDKKLEDDDLNKKRRKGCNYLEELSYQSAPFAREGGEQKENKVRSMATQLQAKFEENAPSSAVRRQTQPEAESDCPAAKSLSLDMAENPRFAKPKHQAPPPPPPPEPKWQPSPYLRLLESQTQPSYKYGNAEAQRPPQHTDEQLTYPHTAEPPFRHHSSESQPCHQTPDPQYSRQTPEPQPSSPGAPMPVHQLSHLPEPRGAPPEDGSPKHLLSSTPALGETLQLLQRLEEKISERKVQTQSAREFSRKSIKERAEQLSNLFSGRLPQACGSAAPVCVPAKPQVVHSHTGRSALSCLLSPFPPAQSKQCNGHPESQQAGAHRHSDRAEIKRIECLDPSKQRTVGKVSSVIGVKAATLAILYETDHRPNNPVTLSLQVNPRKEFAPGVGGSDTCHFCKKRVYIMERLSAEGCFFHRECFRCEVCSTTLRLGGHMFDSDHGTFYCKLHFSQQKKSQRHKKTETHAGSVSSPDGSGGYSAMSSLQSQPPDTLGLNSVTEPQPSLDQNHMLDPSTDPSKVVESPTEQELSEGPAPTDTRPVDSSLQEASTASEPLKPNSLQPNKVAHSNAKGGFSNRTISWKRKIKTTLPLILVKTFDHNQLTEDNSVLIEEDSDFEEIHAPETIAKPEKLSAASQHPLQEEQDQPTLATFARYRPHGILATLTPSYLCPEKPCNYTTPSLEKLPNYTMPLLEKPPNYMTTSLEKPPNYAAPSLEKPPNYMTPSLERPPNCTTPSFEKPPKNTTPSLENPPNYIASSLEKAPNYTIPSLEKPPNYMTPSIEKPPSDMSLFLEKQTSLTPKKKLMLSSSEKDRLLNWDIATPGRFSSAPVVTDEAEGDIQRRRRPENTTQPQNDAVAFAEPSSVPPEPSRNSLLSGFQLWASTLRRSLSGAENNSRSVKRIRPHRARPWSEGSLFGSTSQTREEAEGGSSRAATEGNPLSVKKRSEITTMLEQVTLSAKPPGNSKDDMASLPRRKLNFFSSLRLKRNEVRDRSETDDQTKDILAILSKFRSKDSTQLQQKEEEENYSTDEEDLELDRHRSDAGGSKSRSRKQEELLVLQTKRDQLKRLHRAQVIQRQLEEVEEKQRALEEEGVALEKLLRGENTEPCEDEAGLQQTWFNLVLEKNRLARYESELMIFAQELELEDRQSQLQQDLRHRMAIEDCEKSAGELVEEQALLVEVMKVVEERDQLVGLLEEQRLQERAEDRDLESLILSKGYQFHWA